MAAEKQAELERMKSYSEKVDVILKDMVKALFESQPDDPLEFMVEYLNELKDSRPEPVALPPPVQKPYDGRKRRIGVSAESTSELSERPQERVVYPKTELQQTSIRQAIQTNILFNTLEKDQLDVVVDAMFEQKYSPEDFVIKQGDSGDNFYIVSSGHLECYVAFTKNSAPKLVKKYGLGESFGELALMYNCPRAASIIAKSDVLLWAMDRFTFRSVLMDTTSSKRKRYEGLLSSVEILSGLDKYERSSIADALNERVYNAGEFIIRQGERGEDFFIIEKGSCIVTKSLDFAGGSPPVEVMRLEMGGSFGELALLLNESTRQANVIADSMVTVAYLDRSSFVRLMGPCEEIIARNKSKYRELDEKAFAGGSVEAEKVDSESDKESEVEIVRPPPPNPANFRKRRGSVSSEPMSAIAFNSEEKSVVYPKTDEQRARIMATIAPNILFQSLDDDQRSRAVDCMKEMNFAAGSYIINQGDAGDYFYVLDAGACDCFVRKSKAEQPFKVKEYQRGQSFVTDAVVWAMDRTTFRRMLMTSTSSKRALHESFLDSVPMFAELTRNERARIADALIEASFPAGHFIIKQGDPGDNFYILVQGDAVATKAMGAAGASLEVMQYTRGSYFGELALLSNAARAANVVCRTDVKCVYLDRAAFVRLLGPCDEILKRNSQRYALAEEESKQAARR